MNNISDANECAKGDEVVGPILDQLILYTAEHFKEEEEMMEGAELPDTKRHKLTHNQLVKQVVDMKAKFEEEGAEMIPALLAFLKTWLNGHTIGVDTKYIEYKARKVA